MRRTRSLVLTAAIAVALTACSGGDATEAPSDSADAGGSAVTFTATDTIQWESNALSTSAGTVDLTLVCSPSIEHAVAIEGANGDAALASCQPGATSTGTVDLAAGEYTYFCTVTGHREAGMEGTLTVS